MSGLFALPDGDQLAHALASALGRPFDADECGRSFAVADEYIAVNGLDVNAGIGAALDAVLALSQSETELTWEVMGHLDEDGLLWTRWAPDAAGFLAAVRVEGIVTAALSNATGRLDNELESGGLTGAFDVVLDSAVTGVRKPQARSYRYACEQLGMSIDQASFVGDSLWELRGAIAAGTSNAVWFAPFATSPWLRRPYVNSLRELLSVVVGRGER